MVKLKCSTQVANNKTEHEANKKKRGGYKNV